MKSIDHPISKSLVRIWDSNEDVVGVGFLVTENMICTCAHVVMMALDLQDVDKMPSDPIFLDFPALSEEKLLALVKIWPSKPNDDNSDIALLQLSKILPAGAKSARLLSGESLYNREVKIYGFPKGNVEGGWAEAVLDNKRMDGTVQFNDKSMTGYRVQPGFSGAPVWDKKANGIIGMVVSSELDASAKVAFLIPNELIQDFYANIRLLNIQRPFALLTDGLAGLPGSPLTGVEKFLGEYLGTTDDPAPFGGRRNKLAELDDWLSDTTQPYALMVAEAGRGKSALLSQWIRIVTEEGRANVAFLPISIRFGTAAKSTSLSILGARLRYLNNVHIIPPQDTQLWLADIELYLREDRVEGDPPLLVVIDGADEAIHWVIGQDLQFPLQLGRGIKVLVSARKHLGSDEKAWLKEFGWTGTVKKIKLPPLNKEGVADILLSLGNPLSGLATKTDVISELHRLSEGDPLLVKMYVEALKKSGERAAFLKSKELHNLKPGLNQFFDVWWKDQRKQWGEDAPLKEPAVRSLLNLLACAMGPLSANDLLELADKEDLDSIMLQEMMRPLSRFVIIMSNEQQEGYVFSHSKLNNYFYEEVLAPRDRQIWEQRFLQYGKKIVELLNGGSLKPSEASAYIVKNYGQHLVRGKGKPELFFELIQGNWLRAWESLEGTYDGFLVNLYDAWQRAEQIGQEKTDPLCEYAITQQIRYALIVSSINSLSSNINGDILLSLVEKGLWTPSQALAQLLRFPEENRSANALQTLAKCLPEILVWKAIHYVQGFRSQRDRSYALLPLLSRLIALGQLQEVAALAHTIDIQFRDALLAELLPRLDKSERSSIIEEEIANAKDIHQHIHIRLVSVLVPYLSEPEKADMTQDLLSTYWSLDRTEDDYVILDNLAPFLSGALLLETLEKARRIPDAEIRINTLIALSKDLPEKQRCIVFSEVLYSIGIKEVEDESARSFLLRRISSLLPESLLREAIAISQNLEEWWKSYAMAALAPALARLGHFSEAFGMAQTIPRYDQRAEALLEILPMNDCKEILDEALKAINFIENEEERIEPLVKLSQYQQEPLKSALVEEALAEAKAMDYRPNRSYHLGKIAHLLSETMLERALCLVMVIEDDKSQINTLVDLALHLPEVERAPVFEIIAEIDNVSKSARQDKWRCSYLAERLQDFGSSPLALAAARAIMNDTCRSTALQMLILHQPKDEQPTIVEEALAAAQTIENIDDRIIALVKLFKWLSESKLIKIFDEALVAVRAIPDGTEKAKLLSLLALCLPEEERKHLISEAFASLKEISIKAEGHSLKHSTALMLLAPLLPEPLLKDACSILDDSFDFYKHSPIGKHIHIIFEEFLIRPLAERYIELGLPQEAMSLLERHPEKSDEIIEYSKLKQSLTLKLVESGYVQLALDLAQTIRNPYWKTEAYINLLPHLPEINRLEVLDKAKKSAYDITVNQASGGMVMSANKWALEAVGDDDQATLAQAFARLAPLLPKDEQLPMLENALIAAQKILLSKNEAQSGLLVHLARLGFLHRAREFAQEIEPGWPKAQALQELVHYVAPEDRFDLISQALDIAQAIDSAEDRFKAISSKLWVNPPLTMEEIYPLWCRRLRIIASCTRKDLLNDLSETTPFIFALSNDRVISEIAKSIREVGHLFP